MLLTGRLRDQWHGMSRTGKVPQLWGHTPRAEIALNPADLERRDWKPGTLLRISNRRGALVLPVAGDPAVAPGQAWIPMHWGAATLAQAGANAVCSAATDPVSGQPELKAAAVSITPAEAGWRATWAVDAGDATDAVARLAALRPHLASFDYAALELSGRARAIVVLRVAAAAPPPDGRLAALDALFGLNVDDVLVFDDARRGVTKRALIADGRLHALRLAGEVVAFDWLVGAMASAQPAEALRPWLFAPIARPPVAQPEGGRMVCNCHGVSEAAIRTELGTGADLAQLQARLACGTSCGSCLPELRRLVVASTADAHLPA
jgi:assimilatory nitrate reductase catalytic subunit